MNGIVSTQLHWLPVHPNWPETIAQLRELRGDAAWPALVTAARHRIDFVQTIRLDKIATRCLEQHPASISTQPVRLAVLSSSTVQHLLPGIRVGALRRGMRMFTYSPEYSQFFQELSDKSSELYRFKPNAVLFAFDAFHMVGAVNASETGHSARAAAELAVQRCIGLWRIAREEFGAHVIQQAVLPTAPPLLGQNEHRFEYSPANAIDHLNWLLRQAADDEGVDILAVDRHAATDGISAWHDVAIWHKAKQDVTPAASHVYGDLVGRMIAARQGLSYKCLVLDLDNTLWGGTIGDDGLDGIVLGQGSGVGESYLAFQSYVLALSKRGVILAVCSKNDEVNALAAFEKHPEMLLKRSDIACFVANWEDKVSNLRNIAQSMNIGMDSLVFADDNPFERELVRRELPMVAVPELPDEPALFAHSLAAAGYFEALHLTEEDLHRSQSYQANVSRNSAKNSAVDLAAHLQELRMQLRVKPFDPVDLPRIVQLINKTNQFNLTTQRHTEETVRTVMATQDALTMQLRLLDKFGDNGIIGLVIGRIDRGLSSLKIELWLMSCRVLGRAVEQATMNLIVDKARTFGVREIIGEYLPTAKNSIVREHYRKMGFTLEEAAEDGRTRWRLQLDSFVPLQEFMADIKFGVEL